MCGEGGHDRDGEDSPLGNGRELRVARRRARERDEKRPRQWAHTVLCLVHVRHHVVLLVRQRARNRHRVQARGRLLARGRRICRQLAHLRRVSALHQRHRGNYKAIN